MMARKRQRIPMALPAPNRLQFHVEIDVPAATIAAWPPAVSSAFMLGMAKVIHAAGQLRARSLGGASNETTD
jgi:hypothetical protein